MSSPYAGLNHGKDGLAARQEAIEIAKQAADAAYGESFRKLKAMNVIVHSPYPAALVIVEGTLDELRQVLALDAIIGGMADFEIQVDFEHSES